MALGGNRLRQHVVEFIRGTGVVTDGVVDATSLNGPWTWQVPDGVAELILDGIGAGSGGGGGWNTGTSRAGGGGGATGQMLWGSPLPVAPGSTLTVAVGAGGLGGAPQTDGQTGGNCVISGLLRGAAGANINQGNTPSTTVIWLRGGSPGVAAGSGGGGVGGKAGCDRFDAGFQNPPNGGSNSATPTNGGDTDSIGSFSWGVSTSLGCGGGGGGGASTTGSSAGASGGITHPNRHAFSWTGSTLSTRAAGNTDGTTSYGGGGRGGFSPFGLGGPGGNGQAVGGNATGFGAGGGGGGGGAAGGNGSDGYVRFTYWSVD